MTVMPAVHLCKGAAGDVQAATRGPSHWVRRRHQAVSTSSNPPKALMHPPNMEVPLQWPPHTSRLSHISYYDALEAASINIGINTEVDAGNYFTAPLLINSPQRLQHCKPERSVKSHNVTKDGPCPNDGVLTRATDSLQTKLVPPPHQTAAWRRGQQEVRHGTSTAALQHKQLADQGAKNTTYAKNTT